MVRIEQYQVENQNLWDEFVQNESRNGTIFQEQRFLSYHPKNKFQDNSLLFYFDDILMAVLPAVIQENKLISHPGSSAGGLIFRDKAGLREVLTIIDTLLDHLKTKKIKSAEFRLAENIFGWPVQDELTYSLWHRGFTLLNREISTCIPLQDEYNWLQWGRKKNIFDIRKAEKEGFTVINEKDISIAWHIVNDNLDHRYQKNPTHSLTELIHLKNLYPDGIDPWVCYSPEGIPIATVICFVSNKNTIHDFYIAQAYDKVKINILPFVFQKLLENYTSRGFKWFNFGISSRGDWIKWGILEFKERIGGRGVNRDAWIHNNIDTYELYTGL